MSQRSVANTTIWRSAIIKQLDHTFYTITSGSRILTYFDLSPTYILIYKLKTGHKEYYIYLFINHVTF